jgi:periplasmic divalent cation tolerance protein
MTSIYRWEGEVSVDTERQIVIKTSRARVGPLWERLRELHPYDVPEFVVLPIIDGSDAYLRWIGDSTT